MNPIQKETGETLAEHVDRISTLPDEILSNMILSLLPTKDSVRTSVLSTRWKHVYASVPVIHFEYSGPTPADSSFVSSVSKFLNTVTNKLSHISKFRVHFNCIRVKNTVVISWIENATSHSVQKLDVCVSLSGKARIPRAMPTPHCIFTCETLVSLSLNLNFVLSVPDIVCLPKLKEIRLQNIILQDDESVRRLFSSCPVLESLVVISWEFENARVFNVSVPSLKVLRLFFSDSILELVINCPKLERLSCECYAVRGYSGDVLGSLKHCDIDVGLSTEQLKEGKLIELVKQVCKVQILSLAWDSMQALLIPPCSLPIFENLTRLELTSYDSNGWQLLPSLLDSSPHLETLVFLLGFFDGEDHCGNPFAPPEHVPVCLSFHLKVIIIGRFLGVEDEYKWVEYFLTNALVLEMMEISLWSCGGAEEENDLDVEGEGEGDGEMQEDRDGELDSDFKRQFEISKRLLTFQRSSEVCQIVLLTSDYYED